ncbi:hypothetical protein GQ457_03G027730 [Hibiscus cannabinus]
MIVNDRDVGNVGPIFAFLLFATFSQQGAIVNGQIRKGGKETLFEHALEQWTAVDNQFTKRGEGLKGLIVQKLKEMTLFLDNIVLTNAEGMGTGSAFALAMTLKSCNSKV